MSALTFNAIGLPCPGAGAGATAAPLPNQYPATTVNFPLRTNKLTPSAADAAQATDAADIAAALAGDGEGFARLVARYQQEIANYMWRFTRQRTTYEELVQTAFVEAYLNLGGYRGSGPFGHWLKVIATRVGYRFWQEQARRRKRAEVSLEHSPQPAIAPGDPVAAEAAELVFTLLQTLPPRDRLVLTLIYVEQRSTAEAAKLTGWSQVMVKVQAFRARKKLKKLLEKAGHVGP